MATQVINSPSTSRGQFGIGVEAIGDVDLDGFTDVDIIILAKGFPGLSRDLGV